MGGIGVALALTWFAGATRIGVDAEVRSENRVGVLPVTEDTIMTLGTELTPSLAFSAASRRTEFTLEYGPQILYSLDADRTLLLHRGMSGARTALTRELTLFAGATGALGELDFYRARRLLDPDRGAIFNVPENTVVSYATGDVSLGVTHAVGRWFDYEVGGSLGHTGPSFNEERLSFFREQDNAALRVRASYQLGRHHTLGVEGERNWVWFRGGPYYDGLAPGIFYTQILGRRLTFNARAGMLLSATEFGASQLRDWSLTQGLEPTRRGSERRYLPIGEVSLEGPWYRGAGISARGRVSANLLAFYDPSIGTLEQRAAVAASSDFTLPGKWAGRLDTSVYVPVELELTDTIQPFSEQDVIATVSTAFYYPVDHAIDVELGGLLTERFDDYTTLTEPWRQPEIVIYIALVLRAEVL